MVKMKASEIENIFLIVSDLVESAIFKIDLDRKVITLEVNRTKFNYFFHTIEFANNIENVRGKCYFGDGIIYNSLYEYEIKKIDGVSCIIIEKFLILKAIQKILKKLR
jgi:hypothetical protein